MSEPLLRIVQTALADRYTTTQELGRGGMATVFLAEDLGRQERVALKVLDPELSQSVAGERFVREMDVARNLRHPNIVEVLDSGSTDGLLYYVMPWFAGGTLRDRLLREGQLPLRDALRVTKDVAGALDFAHRQGVIHRDVKPGNILIDGDRALIGDFGVARAVNVAGGAKLTQTGLAVGTPQYMSPEQAAGDRNVDGRADVYSLGCVLYEMLAGQPPFTAPTARALLARHAMDAPAPIRTVRPDLAPELEEVVVRALAKSPADRFATTAEMAAALDDPALLRRQRGFSLRNRTERRAVIGIAAAVAAMAAVLYAGDWRRPDASGPRASIVVAEPSAPASDSGVRQALRQALEQAVVGADLALQTPDGVRAGLMAMVLPVSTPLLDSIATEVAFRTGSAGAIVSSVASVGTGYALSASLRSPDGSVRSTATVNAADAAGLPAAIDSLGRVVRGGLLAERAKLANTPSRTSFITPSKDALRYYVRAMEVWEAGKPLDAATLMQSAIERDPGFAMAYVQLSELNVMLGLDEVGPMERAMALTERLTPEMQIVVQVQGMSTATRDFVRESELAQQLVELPKPQPWYTVSYGYGGGMVASNELGDARRTLSLFDQLRATAGDSIPVDDWMLEVRAFAAAQLGDRELLERFLKRMREISAGAGSAAPSAEADVWASARDWDAARAVAAKVTASGAAPIVRTRSWSTLAWMEAVRGRPQAALAAFDSARATAAALGRRELSMNTELDRAEAAFAALDDPATALRALRQIVAAEPKGSASIRRYRARALALINAICASDDARRVAAAGDCRLRIPVDSAHDELEAIAASGWRAVSERRYRDALPLREHTRLVRGGTFGRLGQLAGAVAAERAGDTTAAVATYQVLARPRITGYQLTSLNLFARSYALRRLAAIGGTAGDSARAELRQDWASAEPGFLPVRELARQ